MVLLPAPLGPTMAKISPSFTSNDTPSTARMPPKEIEMSLRLEQGRCLRFSLGAIDAGLEVVDHAHRTRSVLR